MAVEVALKKHVFYVFKNLKTSKVLILGFSGLLFLKIKIVSSITLSHVKTSEVRTQQYDMIRQKSLTWTRKLSVQLNLAHVARN